MLSHFIPPPAQGGEHPFSHKLAFVARQFAKGDLADDQKIVFGTNTLLLWPTDYSQAVVDDIYSNPEKLLHSLRVWTLPRNPACNRGGRQCDPAAKSYPKNLASRLRAAAC
jgi:hypothetical protein